MPIHDCVRVEPGTFHAFHFFWIGSLCHRLNHGCLPPGFFALPEQHVPGPEADILALDRRHKTVRKRAGGGTAVIDTPPRTRMVESTERYAKKANRIAVRHEEGHVVAFIEIVSPGNKGSKRGLRDFVEKVIQLIDQGVHFLIIDLLPPTKRDPQGIHRAIWEEIHETKFKLPAGKPLTVVAYSAGPMTRAYIEPVAVGDILPDMPLFLEPDRHILTPLESTYLAAFRELPDDIQAEME